MRKIFRRFAFVTLACCCMQGYAQKVKNVILLIPDGCSLATVSASRWYQWYMNPDKEFLGIDPYLCGTIRTTCSNAPIGDSAPTTSTYMTGYNSRAGWVSTYPISDGENDIYPMDASKAYQPLTTIMEASRLLFGKSIGLVSTCEFPHATPADCSSHSYDRNKYEWIMPQQIHNNIDVLIGGGAGILPKEGEAFLKEKGYGVFRNDLKAMRNYEGDRMWALFGYKDMRYDLDRDESKEPELAEMTCKAIEKLSKNPNGFFLMVEGSKVDWAAHDNDLMGMVGDFLAFDKACKAAFDFAKTDGNTAVIVVPDHGNSGISIGRRDWGGYATTPKSKMFGQMANMKVTAAGVAFRLNSVPNSQVQQVMKELCGFELNEKELEALNNCGEYRKSPIERGQRKASALYNNPNNLTRLVGQFMTERTGMAFTTNGHTGEDVFLAAYHPQPDKRIEGMHTNIQLNEYLCQLVGTTHATLDSLTQENFVPHTQLFDVKDTYMTETQFDGKNVKTLAIKTGKGRELWLQANSNQVELRKVKGKKSEVLDTMELPTVTVYVDKNNTFYINNKVKEMAQNCMRK